MMDAEGQSFLPSSPQRAGRKSSFSSHGKFTTIFKGIRGLSPSVFIQHLENEERQ